LNAFLTISIEDRAPVDSTVKKNILSSSEILTAFSSLKVSAYL
jgi:hypothetical protein